MGYGLCECGCGELAPLAATTYRRIGHVKGQPVRFVRGHNDSRAYHKLLHARARVIRRGGDPFVEKICARCDRVLPLERFSVSKSNQVFGRTADCKPCAVDRERERAA